MAKLIELTGKRFGRLRVAAYAGHYRWLCRCDCGRCVIVTATNLRSRNTRSCGCLHKERVTKHGRWGSREYNTWHGMKQRCFNPRANGYGWYGGRGISVCDEWLPFEPFFADMGPCPPGCSIDRIDVNGNYEPSNCRWGDAKQQTENRRPRRTGRAAVKRPQPEPLPSSLDPPF
jgi:hypothetical protein